jgi:hypothetical protein
MAGADMKDTQAQMRHSRRKDAIHDVVHFEE